MPAGELAALVGVEHLRAAPGQRLGTKAGFQHVGQPPSHHVVAVPEKRQLSDARAIAYRD